MIEELGKGAAERLCQYVESSPLDLDHIAQGSDLTKAWLYDLMGDDADIVDNLSIGSLRKLCAILHVTPGEWISDNSAPVTPATEAELRELIDLHLESHSVSEAEFEDKINYTLTDENKDLYPVQEWNLDKLFAITHELKADWRRFV